MSAKRRPDIEEVKERTADITVVLKPIGFEFVKPTIKPLAKDGGGSVGFSITTWDAQSRWGELNPITVRKIETGQKEITQQLYSQSFVVGQIDFVFKIKMVPKTDAQNIVNDNTIAPTKNWVTKIGKKVAADEFKEFFKGAIPPEINAEILQGSWWLGYEVFLLERRHRWQAARGWETEYNGWRKDLYKEQRRTQGQKN